MCCKIHFGAFYLRILNHKKKREKMKTKNEK